MTFYGQACFLLISSVVCASAVAEEAESRVVTVLGSESCSNWTANRSLALADPQYGPLRTAHGQAWMLGYLSGLNSNSQFPNALAAIDATTIFEWTDRYCIGHPKNFLYQAGELLLHELQNMQKKQQEKKTRPQGEKQKAD